MSKRSLAASVALHALLALPLLFGPHLPGKGKHEPKEAGNGHPKLNDGKHFVPKPQDAQIENVVTITMIQHKNQGHKRKGVKHCKDNSWYGGIGISWNWSNNTIYEVAPGYPADRAGLKPGDKIASQVFGQGELGTPVTVTVERNGETITVDLIRERICTSR